MRIKNNKGFTLIELLVVIAIIGMLSSVVLASLDSARSKARDASRLSDIKQIQTALELYYHDNKAYPVLPNFNIVASNDSDWSLLQTELAPYLELQTDPINTGNWMTGYNYAYYGGPWGGSGTWYMLIFRLENSPHIIESQDGVTNCNEPKDYLHYGDGTDGIITKGVSCI